jgi:hypothetical protein
MMNWLHPIRTWKEARKERLETEQSLERSRRRLLLWAITNEWPEEGVELRWLTDAELCTGLTRIIDRVEGNDQQTS